MKIKLSKISLTWISVLLLLFVSVIVILIIIPIRKADTLILNKYDSLRESCQFTTEISKSLVLQCEFFLRNEYIDLNGNNCLVFIIPSQENLPREIEICENSSKISWKNPYPDYQMNIPVSTILQYKKVFLMKKYILKSINVEVMDDKRVFEILDLLNKGYSQYLPVITQEEASLERKGYYLTNFYDSNDSEKVVENRVAFKEFIINDYSTQGDYITFHGEAFINGAYKEILLETKEFSYIEELLLTNLSVEDINVQNVGKIGKDHGYYIQLAITDQKFFDEEILEEKIKDIGELNNSLILKLMIKNDY